MILTKLFALALCAISASAKIYYAGVAESGGEFGVWSNDKIKGTGLPGTFGREYAFINKATVDIFVDVHRINTFRVAFLMERMVPPANGLGGAFDETYFGHFKDAVDYITKTKGAYCILDPHNYMRYGDPSQQPFSGPIIGDTSDPEAASTEEYAAFWGELARRFATNEKVIFGLQNEPHSMPSSLVLKNNQATIDSIRRTGAKQLIIAPGNYWTGGHAWAKYEDPNTSFMHLLKDPANNLGIDVHEYLDVDYSGQHAECVSLASKELAPLTAWLKEHKLKAMITEFGAANNTQCDNYLTDIITYMEDNEEYIGWTAWAAGPFWGSYSPCCTNGNQWGSLEPGSKAIDGSPGLYEQVYLKVIQPLVPKKLQWKGISSIHGDSKPKRKKA